MTEVDYGNLRFSVKRVILHRLVDWAIPAAPSGTPALPVLGCFQVNVASDRLQLVATDMERTIAASTPAVAADGEGRVYLPARRLKAILAEAPEGDITVTVKKDRATVSASDGGLSKGASWDLQLPSPDAFPVLPDLDARCAAVSREKLLAALKTVRHAVCRDSGRPGYTQVRIGAGRDGAMMAASSDANQYAWAPVPGFPQAMAIPGGVLDDLIKVLAASPVEEAEAGEAGNSLIFRCGPVTLSVLKLSAPFPDIDRLALKPARDNQDPLQLAKTELQQAIRRVRINADPSTSAIALVLSGSSLVVAARDDNGNTATESVPVIWGGGDRVLAVSWHYLYNLLDAHPGDTCTFMLGKDIGRRQSMVLLEDEQSGVTGVISQVPLSMVGY
jgi:DNA polymerase III sliding clamp (beta) subunit (PCNA family)